MNIYEEMLDRFHEIKGSDFDTFSEEKELDELLNKLSNCEKINDKYGIDLKSRKFSSYSITNEDEFKATVCMCGGDGYLGKIYEIYNTDKQPKVPEMMLKIFHPTGAYIFGDYYPTNFFKEFFQELKEKTTPEYIDETNHCLYYPVQRTMQVLDIYDDIYKTYRERNKENYRKEMIRRKKAELDELEKQTVQ